MGQCQAQMRWWPIISPSSPITLAPHSISMAQNLRLSHGFPDQSPSSSRGEGFGEEIERRISLASRSAQSTVAAAHFVVRPAARRRAFFLVAAVPRNPAMASDGSFFRYGG